AARFRSRAERARSRICRDGPACLVHSAATPSDDHLDHPDPAPARTFLSGVANASQRWFTRPLWSRIDPLDRGQYQVRPRIPLRSIRATELMKRYAGKSFGAA